VRHGFGGQVVIVTHAREARDADGRPAGWRTDGIGSSVSEVAQESDMIGFVERLDDEHVGVAWFPGHGGRDVTGKNPGLLPKLGCAADDADFLQRMIDRTRERIGARRRAAAGIGPDRPNHPRGKPEAPKRKPQPASAAAGDAPGGGAAIDFTDDIPL